jgi:hypothetical protein
MRYCKIEGLNVPWTFFIRKARLRISSIFSLIGIKEKDAQKAQSNKKVFIFS